MISRHLIRSLLCLIAFLAGCAGPPTDRPEVLIEAEDASSEGLQAFARADWRLAQHFFTRALSHYQSVDDQEGVLQSHINLAETALAQRDYRSSRTHLEQTEQLVHQPSFHRYRRRVELLHAQQALQQNQLSRAKTLLWPLLPAFEHAKATIIPDKIQLAALADRSQIALLSEQDEALWLSRFTEALRLAGADNGLMTARLLRFRAQLKQRENRDEITEILLRQALDLYKQQIHRPGIAATLSELGQVSLRQKKWGQAQNYFSRSLAIYRYLGDSAATARLTELIHQAEIELPAQSPR